MAKSKKNETEHASILLNAARHITLSPSEEKYFTSLLHIQQFKAKEFILKPGQACDNISYVNSGALRSYYCDHKDHQATIMFAIRDWWITDINCFVNQTKSMMSIEVIEDCQVSHLSRKNLDSLFEKVPKFEKFFRILMQNSYIREQMRALENLSLTAEERYINFLKKYPSISSQVPQKHIASYLGITPEFLSTIRRKISKGIRS